LTGSAGNGYDQIGLRFSIFPPDISVSQAPLEPILFADRDEPIFTSQEPPRIPLVGPAMWGLSLGLFCVTCLSTFTVGAMNGWQEAQSLKSASTSLWMMLAQGAAYSGTVMAILLAHEMGHFLQSLRYRVPATPPLFIPMPLGPLGTMGAVIVQAAGFMDRKALFDVAVSGPLAGLVIAIPAIFWGVSQSNVVELHQGAGLIGDPLLVKGIVWFFHGPLPPNHDVYLTGIAGRVMFAGWVGCFITGLNLMPLGQLDGGHILYALIGRRQHVVAVWLFRLALLAMVVGFMQNVDGATMMGPMLILVWMMGIRHPPSSNDEMPLDTPRIILGWLSMLLLIVCFVPIPFQQVQGEKELKERSYPITYQEVQSSGN